MFVADVKLENGIGKLGSRDLQPIEGDGIFYAIEVTLCHRLQLSVILVFLLL